MILNISNIYKDKKENLYLLNQLSQDDNSYSSAIDPTPILRINNQHYVTNYLTDEELRRAILSEDI